MRILLLISTLILSGLTYGQDYKSKYDAIDKFDHGLALTIKNGKSGMIDIKGKVIIPNEYDAIDKFDHGLALTIRNGKSGVIDIQGNVIIPNEFDKIAEMKNGIVIAYKNKKKVIINISEKMKKS